MYGYIYKTTNLINGKIYIGKKKSNLFLENKYLGSGIFLKNAIQKYGKENFKVELIAVCETLDELNKKEIFYIKYYNSTNSNIGYNIAKGGDGGAVWGNIENHPSKHTNRFGNKNPIYGKKCYTNGVKNIFLRETDSIPDNFYIGMTTTKFDENLHVYIYKNGIKKRILKNSLNFFKSDGWVEFKDIQIKNLSKNYYYSIIKNLIKCLNKIIKKRYIVLCKTIKNYNQYKDTYLPYNKEDIEHDITVLSNSFNLHCKYNWHHTTKTKEALSIKLKGKFVSEYTREKIKLHFKNLTAEEKLRRSKNYSKAQQQLCWITNGQQVLRINKNMLDYYKQFGYRRGRK